MSKFIAAFAVATLIATPALAGERTVIVRHADLKLDTAAGRGALNRRIAAATEQVCGSYASVSAYEVDTVKACRAAVARDVARQLSVQLARR
jgi:UrcA family protein